MITAMPNDAQVIDAAFRSILAQDWARLEALQCAHPHLLLDPAGGWTYSRPESYHGVRARSTWNLEETAFVIEAPSEDVARWIGYRIAYDDELEVVWWGTRQTPSGTWAAQFTVYEGD